MGKIIFRNKDLKMVLETNKGTEYRRSWSYAAAAYEKQTGKKYNIREDLDDKYYKSTEPILSLVHDSGVYLMAAAVGKETQFEKSWDTRTDVCYAVGLNPHVNGDWYERAHDAVGGDDFVEDIPVAWIETAVSLGHDIGFNITASQMSVFSIAPKQLRSKA